MMEAALSRWADAAASLMSRGKVTLHRSTSHPSPCVIKCKVAQLTLSLPLTFTLSFLLYFLFLVFIFLCRFLPKTVAEKG